MIKCNNVIFEYKDEDVTNTAVNNVSLEVKEGEFLAVLGHNGSGKSTLAKHFNAVYIPSSGEVIVNGINTLNQDRVWDIRSNVGMVLQNPDNQIVATIVEDDVAFGPENLGVDPSEIRERVNEALDIVKMSEYKKHAPHLLSGGQKQRISIAGILAMKPKCIVLDEPTAMLDPLGRKEIMNTIKYLNKEHNITIILITHFMEEAALADRIVIMDKGKVINEGNPREVFSNVTTLKNIGLDVPQMTELAFELYKSGINISREILSIDEMVDAICQLK